jgi:hypothetical protein
MSGRARRCRGSAMLPFLGTLRVGGSVDQLLTTIRAQEINVEDSHCVRADLSGDVGAVAFRDERVRATNAASPSGLSAALTYSLHT